MGAGTAAPSRLRGSTRGAFDRDRTERSGGKLFDENGEPLYACGATKGERRYRYYVSRRLIRESAGQAGGLASVRAAAGEGRGVGTRQILRDRAALAAAPHEAGASAEEIQSALRVLEAQPEWERLIAELSLENQILRTWPAETCKPRAATVRAAQRAARVRDLGASRVPAARWARTRSSASGAATGSSASRSPTGRNGNVSTKV